MQKLLALLNRSSKTEEQDDWDKLQIPIIVNTYQTNQNHEDTRPTYRIGKHNSTDVERAIDLAG